MPYEKDALKDKGISQETIEYHYGKHHAGYVRKLNAQDKDGNVPKDKSLEDLVKTADGKIFNLAAQIVNHTFYWNSYVDYVIISHFRTSIIYGIFLYVACLQKVEAALLTRMWQSS